MHVMKTLLKAVSSGVFCVLKHSTIWNVKSTHVEFNKRPHGNAVHSETKISSIFSVFRAQGTCLLAANVVLSAGDLTVTALPQIPSMDLMGHFKTRKDKGKGNRWLIE